VSSLNNLKAWNFELAYYWRWRLAISNLSLSTILKLQTLGFPIASNGNQCPLFFFQLSQSSKF
jgi:phage terminase Nu1 subunit (DNA packaging protein)